MNIDKIRKNAELVISTALDDTNVSIQYDRDGVVWLDDFITRHHKRGKSENINELVNTLGAFLGECIIQCYGGHWEEGRNGWCVQFGNDNAVYPFVKVKKHLVNGQGDSVLSMLECIPIVFNFKHP